MFEEIVEGEVFDPADATNVHIIWNYTLDFRAKGEGIGFRIQELLRYHGDKAEDDMPMFLIMAEHWFKTRGFEVTLKIFEGASLKDKVYGKAILTFGRFLFKHNGMEMFR